MIENMIEMYLHCGDCINDRPDGISPSDYQNIQVGLINEGRALQVWCVNHDKHMGIFDLEVQFENASCHDCDHEH
jgi:hypothetical protein